MSTGSIVVSNYTDTPIEVTAVKDDNPIVVDQERIIYTINPKDSCVFFLSRVDALSWEKKK